MKKKSADENKKDKIKNNENITKMVSAEIGQSNLMLSNELQKPWTFPNELHIKSDCAILNFIASLIKVENSYNWNAMKFKLHIKSVQVNECSVLTFISFILKCDGQQKSVITEKVNTDKKSFHLKHIWDMLKA